MLRAKVRGAVNVWKSGTFNNAELQSAYSANGWSTWQLLFTPGAAELNTTTFDLNALYNRNVAGQDGVVPPSYYDNFEIFEYVPGMNLMASADGETTPGTTGRGALSANTNTDWLKGFISAGMTISTENGAWKFANVPAGQKNISVGFLNNNSADNNMMVAGKEFKISYRYKSATADTNVTFKPITGDVRYGSVTNVNHRLG